MSRASELSSPTSTSVRQRTRHNAERAGEDAKDAIADLLSANDDLEDQLQKAIGIIEELESEIDSLRESVRELEASH